MMHVTTAFVIGIVMLVPLLAGTVILQVWLSKRESKWPGLILPTLSVLISLIPIISFAAFQTVTMSVDGEIISQQTSYIPGAIPAVLMMFLLFNIPTAILLAIYFACRDKLRKARDLDKMTAQDL